MEILLNILYFIGLMLVVLAEAIGLFTIIKWFIEMLETDIETLRELRKRHEDLE